MENAACHFVYYTGPRKGDAETFHTARITIGKAAKSDLRLDPSADQVGNDHAEILLEDGNVYRLYDLGTKAGTYVNGERVHDRCTLLSEDYIRFSQDGPEIIFRTGTPPPGKQKLPLVFPVTAEMEFFSGSDAGRIFPINAAIITNIGRRAELEIPLDPRGDMIVSGNHCNIRYVDGHFVLTDSSRNGTYVNGDLVDQPMEIIDNDVIMLGDGGPQARFHVDLAKRHYPNHRPLSPVVKPVENKPSISAIPKAAAPPMEPVSPVEPEPIQDAPVAPVTPKPVQQQPLASAAPFATGTAPLNPPAPKEEPPVEADMDSEGGDTASEPAIPAAEPEDGLTNTDPGTTPTPEETTSGDAGFTSSAKPARPRFPLPGSTPFKTNFKPGKKLIIGGIAAVAVIAIIAMITSGGDQNATDDVRGNYTAALEKLKTVDNTAGFHVSIPDGWTSIQNSNTVSAESIDKELALDYVRDARLNEARIREMIGKNGATVDSKVKDVKANGAEVKIFEASIGDVHRIAALHQSATGPTAAAMLETTKEVRQKLDDKIIQKLLVENLKLDTIAAATPVPATPAPDATLPSPAAATPVASQKTADTTPGPASSPTPGTPAPTAVADAGTSEPAWGVKPVQSKALKLAVKIPQDWKGTSDENDQMLTLSDNSGLEIRIARDEGDLDPKGTFDAMLKEGWNNDGQLPDPRFQAGEFSKSDQNLLLVLIPEKSKTTLVLYATSAKDFTKPQRSSISKVIMQILPAEE